MKAKKLISLGLAAVMSMGLTAPIFAADATPNMVTEFTSEYTAPDIKVTVPQTAKVMLNPLGLDYDLSELKDGSDATQIVKGQQIVTLPTLIVNNSTMNLDVTASVVTTFTGVAASTNESGVVGAGDQSDTNNSVKPSSTKKAFVYLEMLPTTLTDLSDKEAINKAAAKWAYSYPGDKLTPGTGDENATGEVNPEFKSGVVLKASTDQSPQKIEDKLVTLKAAKDGELVSGSVAMVRLSGKLTKNPSTAWTTSDSIVSKATFTFTPAV